MPIGPALAAVGSALADAAAFIGGGILSAVGVDAATAAGAGLFGGTLAGEVGGGVIGAGLGAGLSAATGGNPLLGAATGGLSGGLLGGGAGTALGESLGLSGAAATGIGSGLVGAGVSGLGAAVTGGNVLQSALIGGATTGVGAALLSGGAGTAGTAVGGPGPSAAASAAPASVAADPTGGDPFDVPTGAVPAQVDSAPYSGASNPLLSPALAGTSLGGAGTDWTLPQPTGTALDGPITGTPSAGVPTIGGQSDLVATANDATVGGPVDSGGFDTGPYGTAPAAAATNGWTATPVSGVQPLGTGQIQTGSGLSRSFTTLPSAAAIENAPVGNGTIINSPAGTAPGAATGPLPGQSDVLGSGPPNYIVPTSGTGTGTGTGGGGAATGANNTGLAGAVNGMLGTNLSNSNLAMLGLEGAAIGYAGLKTQQQPKGYNQILSEAGQLQAQSQQLQSYLQSGQLPPGVQAALNQAGHAAAATIRSQYAARGLSGSSAEAADLANVQQTVATNGTQIAVQLLNTGINEAGLASQLYGQIMQTSLQQDAQLSNALTSLATASARPTITINRSTTSG